MAKVSIQSLSVTYGKTGHTPVLRDVSFNLELGEIGCVLGPSGGGKTTLLRAIAGFVSPSAGQVMLDDEVVASARINIAPEHRRVGVVFQDYALFPHLTVRKNIAFGLKNHAQGNTDERVLQMLDLVGLRKYANVYPHELSGGQQQRVAIARALAPQPRLLLLDEPFSSLDVDLRERLSREIRAILNAASITTLLVTHDQNEAFAMADSVGVLDHGQLAQWDAPYEVYHRPATRFVADFVGAGVFVPARMNPAGDALLIELGELPLVSHRPGHEDADDHHKPSVQVPPDRSGYDVLLRPDDVIHDDQSTTTATVIDKTFRGGDFLYTLQLDSGTKVLALVPSHHNHPIGSRIGLRLEVDHVIAFEQLTGAAPAAPSPARV